MSEPKLTDTQMELLIELVRENPGIYDQGLPSYKDIIWLGNCWKKISKKLNVQGMTGDILRRKWKNKRDSYKKNHRIIQTKKSGSESASKVTKITFFDQLTFLDPYIADRSTVSNIGEAESPVNDRELELSDGEQEEAEDIVNAADCSSSNPDDEGPEVDNSQICTESKRRRTSISPVGPPSPTSNISKESSSRRKKRASAGVDKIDAVIMEMSKQMHSADVEMRTIQSNIEARQNAKEDDFYLMISKRMKMVSPGTQQWMEEEVWGLYSRARRMEQAGNGMFNTPFAPTRTPDTYFQPQYSRNNDGLLTQSQQPYPLLHSQQQQQSPWSQQKTAAAATAAAATAAATATAVAAATTTTAAAATTVAAATTTAATAVAAATTTAAATAIAATATATIVPAASPTATAATTAATSAAAAATANTIRC